MKLAHITLAACYSALMFGCAADPGTQPHDMSQAQHEAMAKQEDQSSEAHAAQHDPNAEERKTTCSGKGGCWTSTSNPTAQHAADAEKHRELAKKHRAASAALVKAEASACIGISDDDRDTSPFDHRDDIQSVAPYSENVNLGRGSVSKELGATVVFRAVPGMTAEWLQRVVDCHLARAAAAGFDMPEMNYCPLEIKGVKAKVASTGNGFSVTITSDDEKTVEQIKSRTLALGPVAK